MKIATILFTYNRSVHTQKVLDALSKNEILPQKLYIFQDGIKDSTNVKEWEKVSDVINAVDWCDVEVCINQRNKGLADSIVNGLNYVFQENDAVIVLEDDCITHFQFMTFMNSALKKYQEEKKVYSISGYTWPVEVDSNGTDAYFTRRISSCGWGTWKNRWEEYERDYRILGKIKNNNVLNQNLHIWGEDLESHLLGNIYGACDSWAVFWALKVIEKEGYCVVPYNSYIKNIGYDGSGVHSGETPILEAEFAREKKEILLPDILEFPTNCLENFRAFFRWLSKEERLAYYNNILFNWVSAKQKGYSFNEYFNDKNITKIAIWGTGKICDLLINEINKDVEIIQIIESRPTKKEYKGISVVGLEDLDKQIELIILIPGYDRDCIIKKINQKQDCLVLDLEQLINFKNIKSE